MASHNPGRKPRVTAGVDVRNGAPAADDGFVGMAEKTDTPDVKSVGVANLDLITAGTKYTMEIRGEIDVPNTNLPSIARGALVYIRTTDNAIANATGTNYVPLGKVTTLPGERGLPASGYVRVTLDEKA